MSHRYLFVDMSNIAHENRWGVSYNFVLAVVAQLVERLDEATKPVYVADDSFPDLIRRDERADFATACERRDVTVAPKGVPADNLFLPLADEYNGIVVSNDRFREFGGRFPWIGHPRRLIAVKCLGEFSPRYFWRWLDRRRGNPADPDAEIVSPQ